MKLIIVGAPGAGKGTQASKIVKKYSIVHVSTGDLFRENIKNATELGIEAQKYINKGELVPDELTIDMLLDRISRDDCKEGYILDGFPRTIPQAEALDAKLTELGTSIDAVIDIEVEDEAIIKRMGGRRICPKCGASYHIVDIPPKKEGICDECGETLVTRADDEPETVKHRLETYHTQTEPIIAYYANKGKVVSIDGMQSLDAVTNQIIEKLG